MTPHITLDPNGSGALYCEHCLELHPPLLPCTVERWIDACRGFVLMHKHCPKPVEPSPQLALPHTQDHTAHANGRAPGRSIELPAGGSAPTSEEPNGGAEEARCNHQGIGLPGCEICDSRSREKYGVDGSTDDPAPEIDPPGPYAMFERLYPLAVSAETLNTALAHALTTEQWAALNLNDVARWHPASGIFNAVANWARIEKAHAEVGQREPIAGLTLPRREPMPEKLAELLGEKAKRMKGARPLSSPKRRRNGTGHNGPVNV